MVRAALALLTLALSSACSPSAEAPPRAATAGAPFQMTTDAHEETFRGEIREVVDAGSYVYVRVAVRGKDPSTGTAVDVDVEERWAVSFKKPFHVGDDVTVTTFAAREDFESARTGRVFSRLHFAVIKPATTAESSS